jgi:aspartyl-tRNA(Asn)/glutamyl-tRNA(Gln) amidotransferase subunit A
MTTLADLSCAELAAAIRARKVSPVEAVDAALERIDRRGDLNAFITVCADQARAQAQIAEAAVMRGEVLGPLHGVPVSVKDLHSTAGIRTTMGSPIYASAVPSRDDLPVARTKAAGAIIIGKTTTPEFGHKTFTDGPLFGRTINPHSRDHTCGGSSGGAAVAVASGMGPIALASDGGGSIRIPASCCGVVGLKPTIGAVPTIDAPDLFASHSVCGPIARNVADAALYFRAIAGPHADDPYAPWGVARRAPVADLKSLRVALLLDCGSPLDAEVQQAVASVAVRAEAAGAAIAPVRLDLASYESHYMTIACSRLASRLHGRLSPEIRAKVDPSLVAKADQGTRYSAIDLQVAITARTTLFKQVQRVLDGCDVIVSPTLAAPPLPSSTDPLGGVTIQGRVLDSVQHWYPYTYPLNLTGHPALSMPCGWTATGLPIGLQLVGRWHQEDFILNVATLLEPLIQHAAARPALASARSH